MPAPSFARLIRAPRVATLVGASAVVLWSPMLGMLRSISEIFGPVGGAALVFTAAAVFSALMLGVPPLSAFRRRYLLLGGLLFAGCEISISQAIGLAHGRGQALELVMINYLWPCLTLMFAVLTRQQKTGWLLAPATALCLAGLAMVLMGGNWSPRMLWMHLIDNPAAYGLALTAACMWAGYSLLTRRIGGARNGVPLFMAATAAVLWMKHAISGAPALPLHWAGLAQVACFGLLTASAYACWNHGLQYGDLTPMAIASYFAPALSMLWSCLWLSISPAAGFGTGLVLLAAGSLLCLRATSAEPRLLPQRLWRWLHRLTPPPTGPQPAP